MLESMCEVLRTSLTPLDTLFRTRTSHSVGPVDPYSTASLTGGKDFCGMLYTLFPRISTETVVGVGKEGYTRIIHGVA